jgi:hypothetical protein
MYSSEQSYGSSLYSKGGNIVSRKKRNEWEELIEKHNKPLIGKEKYARLKVDRDTMMNYIEYEGEMATKDFTTKVIQELIKLVSLPDDVYNAVKLKQDRIIRERETSYIRKKISANEEPKGNHGYVYFLKEYHGHTVKIGYAKDPFQRISNMIFVPYIPVEIIHTIPSKNAQGLEKMFHEYFYKKRNNHGQSTEFFELTEEDMEDIYNRNLPEVMLKLIVEEEYEPPPRLRRLERRKQLELESKGIR